MSYPLTPVYRSFEMLPKTVAFGTVITSYAIPYPGPAGTPPLIYSAPLVSGVPKYASSNFAGPSGGVAHLQRIAYTSAGTAHSVAVMRPLNFSTFAADAAVSQATVVLNTNPGLYSTKYAYATPGGVVVSDIADNAIAAGDYVMYQLGDGTWILDTVASGTFGALVLTTNIPAATSGVGVKAGGVLFFFGIYTDSDPATGKPHWTATSTASVTQTWGYDTGSIVSAVHRGDPLVFYSSNATATGLFEGGSGYYSRD